eukprot:927962-Rhodomonas_salina.4
MAKRQSFPPAGRMLFRCALQTSSAAVNVLMRRKTDTSCVRSTSMLTPIWANQNGPGIPCQFAGVNSKTSKGGEEGSREGCAGKTGSWERIITGLSVMRGVQDITPQYDDGAAYYVASIPEGCPTQLWNATRVSQQRDSWHSPHAEIGNLPPRACKRQFNARP